MAYGTWLPRWRGLLLVPAILAVLYVAEVLACGLRGGGSADAAQPVAQGTRIDRYGAQKSYDAGVPFRWPWNIYTDEGIVPIERDQGDRALAEGYIVATVLYECQVEPRVEKDQTTQDLGNRSLETVSGGAVCVNCPVANTYCCHNPQGR